MSKLRCGKFEIAIVERYKRRKSSTEEALMEMYMADASDRRVEDITQALWGMRFNARMASDLNQKLYRRIEQWHNQPIQGNQLCGSADNVFLEQIWAG